MKANRKAFTIVELLALIGMLALLACIAVPCLSRTSPVSKTSQCMNNLRQLTLGFRAWSVENNDVLLSCADPPFTSEGVLRSNWMSGYLDFSGSNRSAWDTNQDLPRSPLGTSLGTIQDSFAVQRMNPALWYQE
jgi:Tfp pilus assembly protein FimT